MPSRHGCHQPGVPQFGKPRVKDSIMQSHNSREYSERAHAPPVKLERRSPKQIVRTASRVCRGNKYHSVAPSSVQTWLVHLPESLRSRVPGPWKLPTCRVIFAVCSVEGRPFVSETRAGHRQVQKRESLHRTMPPKRMNFQCLTR